MSMALHGLAAACHRADCENALAMHFPRHRRHLRALVVGLWTACASPVLAEPANTPAPAPSASPTPAAEPAPAPAGTTSEAAAATTPEATAAPAAAPPPASTDADLAAFQSAVATDAAESAGSKSDVAASAASAPAAASGSVLNPDISVIADFALAGYSRKHTLQAGAHDPALNGFNFQALELTLGAAVDPYFRFDSNIVFDLGGVDVEQAYATTLDLPAQLQMRTGLFLTRFGRANPTHPHAWDYADQPFMLSRVFGGEGNRGVGAELSWLSPLPWYVELVSSVTTATGANTSRSFYGATDHTVDGLADLLYVTAIKQFFPLSDDWSLAWGLSGAFGPNDRGRDTRTEIYGTDLYLKWRPLHASGSQMVTLHAEAIYRRRDVSYTTLQDAGGFASLLWRFAQRWAVASRYELGTATVDEDFHARLDYLDPQATRSRQRVTANLTHYPTEFSRLRLQGSVDMPNYLAQPIWGVLLSLEVAVGAHGAHAF